MNSLFELSRANLWSQLIAIHDETPLPGVSGYRDIYLAIDDALRDSHLGGALKTDILTDPDRFVERDPDVVATLLDQRAAGKRLLLITNSDWAYTNRMMTYTLDAFCPPGITWRDLFDIIIASANKPQFFTGCDPIYRIVDEQASLLLPHTGPSRPTGSTSAATRGSLRTGCPIPPTVRSTWATISSEMCTSPKTCSGGGPRSSRASLRRRSQTTRTSAHTANG